MACRPLRLVLLLSATSLLCSCGYYSFSPGSASHIKTVAIPVFDDRTAEFGIREQLTEALVQEFTRDNTLRIAERHSADSVLEGVIVSVDDRAGPYDKQEMVQELKVYITVDVRYFDLKKSQEVWKDRLTQWGAYDPKAGGTSARQEGINEAIRRLVTEILNRTVSGW
ncbi:MAG: LptE family protein [bacterium]|nr:LPS assembly lipoprotein LptE [candidate division KSB1 bacterium]MDH7560617.1 LptE family protein [bacterium]